MHTNVTAGVDAVMAQLTPKMIRYAADPKRGACRGFAALHDLCDANMLLPHAESVDCTPEMLMFWNRVMDGVSERIIAAYRPRWFTRFGTAVMARVSKALTAAAQLVRHA